VKPARVSSAVLTALITAAVAWFGLDLWTRQGGRLLPLPWLAAVAIVVVAGVVLVLGWEVRRSVRGRRRAPLDPLFAARVAVLAKAAIFGGALLTGWYVAQSLVVYSNVSGLRRERLLVAGATALASVVLTVAGFVAQRWCRLSDDEEPGPGDLRADDDVVTPPPQRRPGE
jgi:polyferredoxin